MPLPQRPPGQGGRPRRTHFCFSPPERGKTYTAFCAGPCHWYPCHWHQLDKKGNTKPCLKEMTEGALTCCYCEDGKEWEEVGYVPLYREIDGKPVFVIVHAASVEEINKLSFTQYVLVGRLTAMHEGVYVIQGPRKDKYYRSTLAERQKPADLTETLLRVWKMPELVDWYRRTHGQSDKPVSPPPPPPTPGVRKRSDGKPFSPMTQAAAARNGIPPADGPDGEEYDAALRRAKERAEQREKLNGHA